MAEAKQIVFEYPELAEILVRNQGIQRGHWGVYVQFALGAANVAHKTGDILPTALVPVMKIGIQEFDKPNNLTFDASLLAKKSKQKKKTAS